MRNVNETVPAWVGITYLLYMAISTIVALGGCGYAVFVLGHSGWWFALGVFYMSATFRPWQWNGLFTGEVIKYSKG